MNQESFGSFVNGAFWICAAMALISLLRWKKNGPQSLILCGAFLVMGGLLWRLGQGSFGPTEYALAGVLGMMLVADMLTRRPAQG